MNLQIQCPKCSKRFTVHEDLSGKTVECGSCDHRFPVKPESVIVEKTKVYPGEQREDDFLNRLGRQPSQVAARETPGPAENQPLPKVDAIMPASAAQNIAAVTGAAIIILYALFFLIGTTKGGMFQDVVMTKRIVLASFVGVVGASLIIYGAKKWRARAVVLSLVLAAGLAGLTAIRPVITTPKVSDELVVGPKKTSPQEETSTVGEGIKEKVGYEAVERKLAQLETKFGANAPEYLIAIFIEDLGMTQLYNLERYFKKVFDMPENEAINRYKRNRNQDSLLVISGIKIDFEEAVRHCEPRLGRVTTYPELRLIDLELSLIHSTEVSEDLREKLSDPRHRSFFATNLKELGHINSQRVKDAVRKLAMVPDDLELQYEDQILIEFLRLLGSEDDPALLKDLATAFRRWAPGNPASLTVVSQRVGEWLDEEAEIEPGFIAYLVENKEPRGVAYVDQLWSQEPENWFRQYALAGASAEPLILEHLKDSPMRLKKAAARLLASIGTEQALPVLQKFSDSPDEELRIVVERAITAIEGR